MIENDEFRKLKAEEVAALLKRIDTNRKNPILDSHDVLLILQALEYFLWKLA